LQYRPLGLSGVKVSALALGCMTFGREIDELPALELIERYLEVGGNFIDTADVYSAGRSEEIVGKAIKKCRDDIVLATKVRFPMGSGPNDQGLSRKHLIRGLEASLRRLNTDYIDLYQVHGWDANAPLEETLSALSALVRQGKVRYIGASNFAGWQLVKALSISESRGFEKFVSVQLQYSLVERSIEYEIVPACQEIGIGIIPWGPLGQGFLSGKYRRDQLPPEGSRLATAEPDWEEHWSRRATEVNWHILDAVQSIAGETGRSASQVALNWLLHQPAVSAVSVGARSTAQLDENLGAVGWELTEEQLGRLDVVSRPRRMYPYPNQRL